VFCHVGFFCACFDATHRDGATDAMATDEQTRLKSIVETAVDGIITIDDRGIIHSFNAAATRLFGYAADEVIGTDAAKLMEADIKQNIGIGREVVGQRKEGSTFPMRLAHSGTAFRGGSLESSTI
jgi:PAS domain S-box-containing protein